MGLSRWRRRQSRLDDGWGGLRRRTGGWNPRYWSRLDLPIPIIIDSLLFERQRFSTRQQVGGDLTQCRVFLALKGDQISALQGFIEGQALNGLPVNDGHKETGTAMDIKTLIVAEEGASRDPQASG